MTIEIKIQTLEIKHFEHPLEFEILQTTQTNKTKGIKCLVFSLSLIYLVMMSLAIDFLINGQSSYLHFALTSMRRTF